MAEEKVGFGFEFGIKGEQSVKRGIEDILSLMAKGQGAANVFGSALGSLGKFVEFGAPLLLAGTAIATFGVAAYNAGENLRKARYEIDQLSKVPSFALSDSDLSANTDAILEKYKDLGLEAGNQFTAGFGTKLKNFATGAYAVNWDVQASIANLFGAGIKSYESTSPEAEAAQNRVAMNQRQENIRITQDTATQKDLNAASQTALEQLLQLFEGRFKGKDFAAGNASVNGTAMFNGRGVLPESYQGLKRQRDIATARNDSEELAIGNQLQFDQERMRKLQTAPLAPNPASGLVDEGSQVQRAKDLYQLQQKINEETEKTKNLALDSFQIAKDQRMNDREYVRNQNYGWQRALGLGGRAPGDSAGLGQGHPANVLGGIMLKQVDFLGEINKNIGKLGIPTILN